MTYMSTHMHVRLWWIHVQVLPKAPGSPQTKLLIPEAQRLFLNKCLILHPITCDSDRACPV